MAWEFSLRKWKCLHMWINMYEYGIYMLCIQRWDEERIEVICSIVADRLISLWIATRHKSHYHQNPHLIRTVVNYNAPSVISSLWNVDVRLLVKKQNSGKSIYKSHYTNCKVLKTQHGSWLAHYTIGYVTCKLHFAGFGWLDKTLRVMAVKAGQTKFLPGLFFTQEGGNKMGKQAIFQSWACMTSLQKRINTYIPCLPQYKHWGSDIQTDRDRL